MNNNEYPYWYRLIYRWCADGNTGLSIPYLVGAQTVFDVAYVPTINDVREFLRDVFSFQVQLGYIRIKWCRDIHCYVIGLCEDGDLDDGMSFNRVHIAADVLRAYENTELAIIEGFALKYQNEIEQGVFSIFKNKWYPFSEADRNFILTTVND